MGTDNSISQATILGDYDRLQATEKLSLRASAQRMGIPYSRLYRALKAREDATANGNLPALPPSPPIATHRSEPIQWVSRGLQVAADLLAAIDAYAAQHRLEKREVLDLALRTFFAQVEGKGVARG